MPHRTISMNNGKVLVKKEEEDPEYHGKEMSDGERILLYLLGQCLSVPENSIIIIDEPELHLHKSLMSKLWNKIEELCPSILFIYITHDLDFASSRTDSHKLWIKKYNGNDSWEWDFVPDDEIIPENLILEIIGNRKAVIFSEGEKGSLDNTIYQLFYSNYHIIPRGGGDKVIETTKALRANENLHHLKCFGIIDSDYKEDEEKQSLLTNGIHTLAVAEIESLICTEPILKIIAKHLALDENSKVEEVKDYIVKSLNEELQLQIANKTEKIIEYKLGAFSKESNDLEGITKGLDTTLSHINIEETYNEIENKYKESIENRDLKELLLLYNRKSLPNRISHIFGLAKNEYEKLFIRLLKNDKKEEIIDALKEYLPEISSV